MKKSILSTTMMALGLISTDEQVSQIKTMEINKNTGIVTLGSLFPNIGQKYHRNGRSNNKHGLFGVRKFNY